jgi:hypothetical protein
MKAFVDGMRSLLYFVGFCQDKIKISTDPSEKEKYQLFIELLTPIAKGYVTDRAYEVCNHGLQVYGGYGYIRDYPMEQLVRDCRITMIYEGTNGIQAMDLLGRKLGLNGGKALTDLLQEMTRIVDAAKAVDNLKKMADKVEKTMARLGETAMRLGEAAMSVDVGKAFAWAYPFMEVFGDTTMAWMLLWRALIADEKLKRGGKGSDADFYRGQIMTAEFFIYSVLPATLGKMDAIREMNGAAVEMPESGFGV